MSTKMGGRLYQAAKAELRSRGDAYCWRGCGTWLLIDAPVGHPQQMTLGHYRAREDGGALYDPENYGPECAPCNYGDGARRTNEKTARRLGRPVGRAMRTNESTDAQAYEDDAWYQQPGPSMALDITLVINGCPICGEQLRKGRKYCTQACKVEAAARRTRERYRMKVGMPLNPDQPTRPRGRVLELF